LAHGVFTARIPPGTIIKIEPKGFRSRNFPKNNFAFASLLIVTAAAQAQLYGVGQSGNGYGFASINTTTGASTALFNFSVPGTTAVQGLSYIPSPGKFVTVGFVDANNSKLVEIDASAQTATVVAHGIRNTFFEGLEYSASLGGLVVSRGPGGFFSGSLSLMNPST